MNDPNLQPTLVGPRVTLRPMRSDDWDEMFAAASDPAIWAVHPERHRYQESQFWTFFEEGLKGGTSLTILANDTNRIVGSSRYFGYEHGLGEIEIGWTFLTCSYWGGDYNREVKQLMLNYAFGFVQTVVFWVGENNFRSRRAMEKIGGIMRECMQMREYSHGPCPHFIYEIRKGGK